MSILKQLKLEVIDAINDAELTAHVGSDDEIIVQAQGNILTVNLTNLKTYLSISGIDVDDPFDSMDDQDEKLHIKTVLSENKATVLRDLRDTIDNLFELFTLEEDLMLENLAENNIFGDK